MTQTCFETSLNASEMWQIRIHNTGVISLEHGGPEGNTSTAVDPGNHIGWYDFQLDIDFGDDFETEFAIFQIFYSKLTRKFSK